MMRRLTKFGIKSIIALFVFLGVFQILYFSFYVRKHDLNQYRKLARFSRVIGKTSNINRFN